MPTFFFFALLFVLSPALAPATSPDYPRPTRRFLHQPFFPLDSFPPTQAPASAPQALPRQQPKFPFSSSSSNKQPFFPTYASPPPPPSPTALATFPANISSLLFPHSSSRKGVSPKLVAIAVGVSIAAVALVAMAAVLLHHRCQPSSKDPRSDSLRLFPANTAVSDGIHHHKQPRSSVSGTSSEFLYLGTLVNSRGVDDEAAANSSNAGTKRSGSASPPYQKLSSPELRPLPPLPRQNFRHSFRNADVRFSIDDEEDEEFFSPRGSSSPAGAGSTSRPEFSVAEAENYRGRSLDSRTPSYPSSNSASPTSSTSNSPSPPLNSSPEISKSKSPISYCASSPLNSSPETLKPKSPTATFNFPAPPPLRPPPPVPRRSRTPSPPSEIEELEDLGRKISDVSGGSPQKHEAVSIEIPRAKPPPPPPPPPPRFWELPADPTPIDDPFFGPPALLPPSRPVVLQNPAPESEQPEGCEALERNGETPKPKLKPLHWDKVRASSDRAMVWDQLKSSSFQ